MTTGVSLVYDTGFLGNGVGECSPVASPKSNATVLEMMNQVSSVFNQGHHCHAGGHLLSSLTYIVDFLPDFGNVLKFACFNLGCQPEKQDYNMSSMDWQLYINDAPVNTSMSTTQVSSNDKIKWAFQKKT